MTVYDAVSFRTITEIVMRSLGRIIASLSLVAGLSAVIAAAALTPATD